MHEPPTTQKVCQQKDSFKRLWKRKYRKGDSWNRLKIQKSEFHNDWLNYWGYKKMLFLFS